ncbi:aspartate carbamoyltransferase [Oceanobacillus limi]|uniref:Aspartate carbamoyltransferase n=1 Tax=Oceanobacillus limi TaxID=930131 RepID=A0A1I0DFI5_9BACI|nr:aspartate carbamoyltransferase catalytic subunit [Oceanobacillus limi]SET30837.1 aspartate carbamoyltransferase [Oceanobacillus limi]
MRHFFSTNQLTTEEIYQWLETAEAYRTGKTSWPKLDNQFVANLFFEPSTRTKMSFVVAQRKLGMDVLDFHTETSSMKKGESLYDTAKTFESIGANLLVIRHESDDWFNELDKKLSIPIINAGSGKTEHPTQCMLDLLTIYQEFGRIEDLEIAIVGDLKHSRVARTNALSLQRLGAKVYLSAPEGFEDESLNLPYLSIDEATEHMDVIMLLRVQHERHIVQSKTENYLNRAGLTKNREKKMKPHAIILHPAPVNRGVEIDSELVECNRSRIFKQMENGVYARMAVMTHVLQEWGKI